MHDSAPTLPVAGCSRQNVATSKFATARDALRYVFFGRGSQYLQLLYSDSEKIKQLHGASHVFDALVRYRCESERHPFMHAQFRCYCGKWLH